MKTIYSSLIKAGYTSEILEDLEDSNVLINRADTICKTNKNRMINSKYYDLYFPESGVKYFNNEASAIIIWEGFFDDLFLQMSKDLPHEEYPIEFRDYNGLEGWKEGESESRQIDPSKTIQSLKGVLEKEVRPDYKNCYTDLLNYLTNNSHQEVFIIEYF